MNTQHNQNASEKDFELLLKRKNRIIGILSAIILIFLIFLGIALIRSTAGVKFRGSAPYPSASPGVDKFRNRIFQTHKSYGVWYSENEIKEYLDKVYPNLVAAQNDYIFNHYSGQKPDTVTYKWNVGFTWMIKKEEEGNKIDFFVIPLLVNKDNPTDVYDYYDEKKSPFYDRAHKVFIPNFHGKNDGDSVNYSFNTGTMFP